MGERGGWGESQGEIVGRDDMDGEQERRGCREGGDEEAGRGCREVVKRVDIEKEDWENRGRKSCEGWRGSRRARA